MNKTHVLFNYMWRMCYYPVVANPPFVMSHHTTVKQRIKLASVPFVLSCSLYSGNCVASFSSPAQMLQSVVDLGFQYNLPSFVTVSDHCLPIFLIPFIVKSSSTSSHHLLHGLLVLVPSIVAVVFCFGIHSAWPYHISQRVFVNITISTSCNVDVMF